MKDKEFANIVLRYLLTFKEVPEKIYVKQAIANRLGIPNGGYVDIKLHTSHYKIFVSPMRNTDGSHETIS